VVQLTDISLDQRNYASGALAQEAHMAACPFTKMTEVQNFVTQLRTEMAADPVWRSCARGRIAVERIGHSRHWRVWLVWRTSLPRLTFTTLCGMVAASSTSSTRKTTATDWGGLWGATMATHGSLIVVELR